MEPRTTTPFHLTKDFALCFLWEIAGLGHKLSALDLGCDQAEILYEGLGVVN